MTLQKMRISEIHATAGILLESRSCCLANRGLRACGEALATMAYAVKKNDWTAISQESRCTMRLSSCWIWSRMVRYQSAGLSRLAAGILMRFAPCGKLGCRKWAYVCSMWPEVKDELGDACPSPVSI